MKKSTATAVLVVLTGILLVTIALLAPTAHAQPAPAASAPAVLTEADITFDSTCGDPGIGRQWSDRGDRKRGDIHYRDGQPGIRVGPKPSGWWSVCKMPPPPRDCPETAVEPWRGKGGWGYCVPAKHSLLRAQNVGRKWGVATAANTTTGRGSQVWECTRQPDGSAAWVLVRSNCNPG